MAGELVWVTVGTPTILSPTFSGQVFTTWGSTTPKTHGSGVVTLPNALGSTSSMRVRISEIDYYEGDAAPAVMDSTYRRPFVTTIPIN